MVSAAFSDALFNPTRVLEHLYTAHDGPMDGFASHVAKHFREVFDTKDAFQQIPPLSVDYPPEIYPSRSLVRFRAMVQDTLQPEIYASIVQKKGETKLGGWGLAESLELEEDEMADLDYANLKDRTAYWAVSVVGESEWVDKMLLGDDHLLSEKPQSHQSIRPHKYPIPGAPHIGAQIKVYDSSQASYKSTDIVTFVGILTSESLSTPLFDTDESSQQVPSIHVLFSRTEPRTIVSFPRSLSVSTDEEATPEHPCTLRDDLIDWIAEEALGGDRECAEWVLLISISRVFLRNPPILPPSLAITKFPPTTTTNKVPTLVALLSFLLPITQGIILPANLTASNGNISNQASSAAGKVHFAPHSEQEDLHAGVLQMPVGTLLTVVEMNLQEGNLPAGAAENIKALQALVHSQKLQYHFPFSSSSQFEFPTDVASIIFSETKKSTFFPEVDIVLPMEMSKTNPGYNFYKSKEEITLPSEARLRRFRQWMCEALLRTADISREMGNHVESDFVADRKSLGGGVTGISSEDLILRMNLARLLSITYGEPEVTVDIWLKVKALDGARKERVRKA